MTLICLTLNLSTTLRVKNLPRRNFVKLDEKKFFLPYPRHFLKIPHCVLLSLAITDFLVKFLAPKLFTNFLERKVLKSLPKGAPSKKITQ